MTQEHPITPPPELFVDLVLYEAFQCGADQKLDACVNYVDNNVSGNKARALREHRRPKPPSLKEQALAALETQFAKEFMESDERDIIRRAIASLPD